VGDQERGVDAGWNQLIERIRADAAAQAGG
jgi:hypothetical protein